MERKEYIDRMQRAMMKSESKNFADEDLVEHDGIRYYPCGYVLSCDTKGNPTHTARLHDLKANSVVECQLDKVNVVAGRSKKDDEKKVY